MKEQNYITIFWSFWLGNQMKFRLFVYENPRSNFFSHQLLFLICLSGHSKSMSFAKLYLLILPPPIVTLCHFFSNSLLLCLSLKTDKLWHELGKYFGIYDCLNIVTFIEGDGKGQKLVLTYFCRLHFYSAFTFTDR